MGELRKACMLSFAESGAVLLSPRVYLQCLWSCDISKAGLWVRSSNEWCCCLACLAALRLVGTERDIASSQWFPSWGDGQLCMASLVKPCLSLCTEASFSAYKT